MTSKKGSNRKWSYEGVKKYTSIRLSKEEKELILSKFESVQAFVQHNINIIKQGREK